MRHLWGLALCLGGLALVAVGAEPERHPPGHEREGLPTSDSPVPTYAPKADHWLNELHALLFTQTQIPRDVASVLPGERAASKATDAEFFVKGWQFGKRPGVEKDRATFGGDVRVSGLTSLDEKRRERLLELLNRLDSRERVGAVGELKSPLARLLLQWDVVSVWWRLEQDRPWKIEPDIELFRAFALAARALALSPAEMEKLPTGFGEIRKQFARADKPKTPKEAYLPPDRVGEAKDSPWVEVERKSTKLFRGDVALRASRVWVNAGTRDRSLNLVEGAVQPGALPVPPEKTEVALALSLVGFDENLAPVATGVIDEVRVRRLTGPFERSAENATSSKDGVDHWVYFRSRPGSLWGGNAFRFVPDTAQSLFLEYGSAKHTTFAAQCALCHRSEVNTARVPRGILSLNPSSKPRPALDPFARLRLAEEEMRPVAARLREYLDKK